MKFLTANWHHLLLANYQVDPDLLQTFVPEQTSIDPFEGKVYLSLVAFMFEQTRVLGVPIPGYRCFEEVNLRFYVTPDKDPSIRAVTFIREIVPKPVIPLIANSLFHENYIAMPMDHTIGDSEIAYAWGPQKEHTISATIPANLSLSEPGSMNEFITEHYWGYAKAPKHTSLEYQVEHPPWIGDEVKDYSIQVDFARCFGEEFGFLSSQQPANVQYAKGSDVSVSFPKKMPNKPAHM